jgi:hypothetical protein
MLYLLLQKKKCKNCGRLTHKDVLFCWFCGCSFDYRVCISGHKNPAWVQYCLTCGKDRSLMSRPHSSKELSFAKHPTKPFTYIPGRQRADTALAWFAVCLGAVILICVGVWVLSF